MAQDHAAEVAKLKHDAREKAVTQAALVEQLKRDVHDKAASIATLKHKVEELERLASSRKPQPVVEDPRVAEGLAREHALTSQLAEIAAREHTLNTHLEAAKSIEHSLTVQLTSVTNLVADRDHAVAEGLRREHDLNERLREATEALGLAGPKLEAQIAEAAAALAAQEAEWSGKMAETVAQTTAQEQALQAKIEELSHITPAREVELVGQLEAATASATEWEQKHKETTEALAVAEKTLAETNTKLSEANVHLTDLRELKAAKDALISSEEARIKDLEEQTATLKTTIAETAAAVAAQVADLNTKLAVATAEANTTGDAKTAAEAQVILLTNEVTRLTDLCAKTQTDGEDRAAQLLSMTDKATADLEAATLHLTAVQAELATAQAAIQAGEGVIADLRAQIEGLRQNIADKDAAAKKFAEERAAEVSAASAELVKVMGEVAAAGEANTKLTASNLSLNDTIKAKDGEIATLTDTIAKLRVEATDRATLMDNLRVQLAATQAAMAETEAVLAVKSDKLDSTLADHSANVLLLDNTKAQLEAVAQELAKHEAQEALLANLSADNTSLARIHRDLVIYKRKCFNLTQEAHANNAVIDRLSKQIDETEATTRVLLQKQHKQLTDAHAKETHLLKEMVRSAQQDAANCRLRFQRDGSAGFTSSLLFHFFKSVYLVIQVSDSNVKQKTMVLQTNLVTNVLIPSLPRTRLITRACFERLRTKPHRSQDGLAFIIDCIASALAGRPATLAGDQHEHW
jgi:chromosome segregation ATPase